VALVAGIASGVTRKASQEEAGRLLATMQKDHGRPFRLGETFTRGQSGEGCPVTCGLSRPILGFMMERRNIRGFQV
jgi:hypothetical protein